MWEAVRLGQKSSSTWPEGHGPQETRPRAADRGRHRDRGLDRLGDDEVTAGREEVDRSICRRDVGHRGCRAEIIRNASGRTVMFLYES